MVFKVNSEVKNIFLGEKYTLRWIYSQVNILSGEYIYSGESLLSGEYTIR